MGVVLLVCGAAALVSALPAGAFLPDAPRAKTSEAPDMAVAEADARQ
jgi:hypothetical protein